MTLQAEYEACMEVIDQLVFAFTDFDGTAMHHYADGSEAVISRMNTLEELMDLSKPVYLTSWRFTMAHQLCPCPGIPRERWEDF